MLGDDEPQVIDAGCRWRRRRLGLWDLAMHMATNDERDGLADGTTFQEHVQTRQVLWIEAQLDAASDE